MPTLTRDDMPVKKTLRGSLPPETRTYQVLCDSCERWAQTIYLTGPHVLGQASAAFTMAIGRMNAHARLFQGHRVYLLKHTQNELLETRIEIEEGDGA